MAKVGMKVIDKIEELNPREVLIDIIRNFPELEKEKAFDLFREEIIRSKEMQRAVQWYFFINMYEYETTKRCRPSGLVGVVKAQDPSATLQRRLLENQIVESIKEQLMMLDLMMPNEKLMRDCTGAEMEQFGTRYQRIAQKVGKTKLVGSVLNESQIRQILLPVQSLEAAE